MRHGFDAPRKRMTKQQCMDAVAERTEALSKSARDGYAAKGMGCMLMAFVETGELRILGKYLSRDEVMNWPVRQDTLNSFRTLLDLYDPQTQMVVVISVEDHIIGSGILALA